MRLEGLGKLKKINSLHGVSNPRPPGLQHSASTTMLPRAPHLKLSKIFKKRRKIWSQTGV
jgi:hypothetical protein